MADTARLSWGDCRQALRSGELPAAELTERHLARIASQAELNAFITPLPDRAREQAAVIPPDDSRPLAAMPIAVKDTICVAGVPTTCGSRMLRDWVAPYDATAVERLREAGAVIVGKTNCDEFGMGSSNEQSHFGPVRNPVDPERTPGGSSGGSAVAVADGQAVCALGSDTGGSVRTPASFCGVVGLKPTYGAVSRWGLVAYGSSLDQIGVLARCADDAALVFDTIAGRDHRDATSVEMPERRELPDSLKIGVPREYFGEGLDGQVQDGVMGAVASLEGDGAVRHDVSLPRTPYAVAAYYVIACAEASSNLARYDGVRYGYRASDADDLAAMYRRTRSEGFGPEVKRRIILGTHVLSAGYHDEYYGRAQRVRALLTSDFERVFESVDCLITPSTPTCAFKLGEKIDDPLTMYLVDIYTVSVNLAGLPAVSVPFGANADGLPIGVQIIGRPFEEHVILDVARRLEGTRGGR